MPKKKETYGHRHGDWVEANVCQKKCRNHRESWHWAEYGRETSEEEADPRGNQQSKSANQSGEAFIHRTAPALQEPHPCRGELQLLAGEALEVRHLALHFLPGRLGGGADSLHAQP